ncbi:hypothetical protein GH733_010006 [Mirounga leonina]|nr:hypothetical protein GH733_010006 [Mirounga leonina]
MWYEFRRAFVTVMPKRGKKGAVAEDREEPKTEPEAMKILVSSFRQGGVRGVGLLSGQCPLQVSYGIGEEEHDQEGRVTVAESVAYVPNAGRGLVRLEYWQRWDEAFRKFLKGLASRKPLVLRGDFHVAHEEIDLRNPKGNKKNAGFTPQERQGFGELL